MGQRRLRLAPKAKAPLQGPSGITVRGTNGAQLHFCDLAVLRLSQLNISIEPLFGRSGVSKGNQRANTSTTFYVNLEACQSGYEYSHVRAGAVPYISRHGRHIANYQHDNLTPRPKPGV